MLTGSAITRVLVIVVLAAGLAGVWQSLAGRLAPVEPAPTTQAAPPPAPEAPVRSVYAGGGEARPRPLFPDPVPPATEAAAEPAPPTPPPVFAPPVSTPLATAAAAPLPYAAPAPAPEEPPPAAAAALGGIDLNTATLAELNGLRGGGLIGKAIIAGRPYGSPQDLLSKRILSRTVFERIRDQVTVR
ncbi:ComEA family DNA-binding protein [Methylobacterium sp. ID0610]|uniref:ComEA family DNA-binding protein n=1 Tax=Methylobacterium carpenticola TaxID=3344827 RepID=UPI00368BB003